MQVGLAIEIHVILWHMLLKTFWEWRKCLLQLIFPHCTMTSVTKSSLCYPTELNAWCGLCLFMVFVSSFLLLCLSTYQHFNPFPHTDTFWHPLETSLLKTLWEKEKLLITSNFSFFHSVFCHFRQIWNCRLQTLSVWKSLKFVVW